MKKKTNAPVIGIISLRQGASRHIYECTEERYFGPQTSWLSADAIEGSEGRRLTRAELVERASEVWQLYSDGRPWASERKGFEEWLGKWGKQVAAALDWEDGQ